MAWVSRSFAFLILSRTAGWTWTDIIISENVISLIPFPDDVTRRLNKSFRDPARNKYYMQHPIDLDVEFRHGTFAEISSNLFLVVAKEKVDWTQKLLGILSEHKNICIRCLRVDGKGLLDHPIHKYQLCVKCLVTHLHYHIFPIISQFWVICIYSYAMLPRLFELYSYFISWRSRI